MRKIYLFAAAATFALSAEAQTEVYFDDFESNSLEGYTLYNLDGLVPDDPGLATMADSAWTIRFIQAQGWPHGRSAFSVSWYENDEGPSDDWLVTPAINIEGEAVLTWDAMAITSSGNFRDRYMVFISPSPDIDVIADEAVMVFDTGAIGEETDPTPREVDLAAEGFENQTIYICFRNNTQGYDPSLPTGNGNGGNELVIDNIRVTDNSEPLSVSDTEVFGNAGIRPNPVAGSEAEISFSLEQPEQVFIDITDISGKVISSQNRGIMASGSHIVRFNRNGTAAGIYLVRLRTPRGAEVMKVVFE